MRLILILLLSILLYSKESCLVCHKNTSDIDRFHQIKDMGCASCHGGNKSSTKKEIAHKNMVKNPARLEHAKIFCAKCHKDIVDRVENSIMNIQSGILDVLRYQFKESKNITQSGGIKDLKEKPTKSLSLAQSHFSKLCAACHINQKESDFKKIAKRGGGCVDCHRVSEKAPKFKIDGFRHSKFTTRIKNSTCLKCHNRSNRIGLSYIGKFESEGYNHYKDGRVDNRLDIHRSFYNLPSDIHHAKGSLSCIDCHTEVGVMGDGREHLHMEEAVDISCNDCHKPTFKEASSYPLATKLAFINGKVPLPKDKIAITKRKKSPLYNLQKIDNKVYFFRKSDGKSIDLPLLKEPYHSHSFHKRLDCSACHTQWIASCYGCHEVYIKGGKQFDWIKHKKTQGQWQELRSFLRFEDNTLAIGYNGKIMPSAPGCQVIMSIYEKNGTYNKAFDSLAYGAWSPHTIGKSKECKDCHNSSSAIGLGQGIFKNSKDGLKFIPYFDSKKSGFDFDFNIDALVDINGTQKQSFSRDRARAFNKQEIAKITDAYKCIICHNSWNDKIYQDFNRSKKLFFNKETKCAKEILR
jgi:nitrate/TMAO reductase-like tetraheme cytochrome c subunit